MLTRGRRSLSPTSPSVDAYLAALPEDQRSALADLRATIKAAVPEAVESIAYQMPAYKYKGKPLIYFGAAKNHCGIYGARAEDLEELKAFEVSKGTVRFSPDKPVPPEVVRRLVKARMAEIEAGAAKGYGNKKGSRGRS
jgi:uncharacterized protein YdhG (YjbR/CyaY superfamily)